MNAFVFQKHMCKTCDKKIEITQHIFMGINHHFCSYLCRRHFLMKSNKPKLNDENEKETNLTMDRNNSILQQILNFFFVRRRKKCSIWLVFYI
jgi:hypothetical protein